MRFFLKIIILFFLSNCSFDNSSKNDRLEEILLKSNNVMSMTFNEYKIFVDDYNKKSGYPNIEE
jgi:hypothetical protein